MLLALGLTLLAGSATALGSLLGLAVKNPGKRFMAFTLGFSAGVMVFVSFLELFPRATESLGMMSAFWGFAAGALVMTGVDFLVPHHYIGEKHGRLGRTALLVALGIAIHNFPEGLATFSGALKSPKLGLAIAFAIAIHNIPEGLAISAPVYAATGSRGKAFLWSALSGLAEPAGALTAALVLWPFLNEAVLSWALAFVSGLMVLIAVDELVPSAKSFGAEHWSVAGFLAGALVMTASLSLMS